VDTNCRIEWIARTEFASVLAGDNMLSKSKSTGDATCNDALGRTSDNFLLDKLEGATPIF